MVWGLCFQIVREVVVVEMGVEWIVVSVGQWSLIGGRAVFLVIAGFVVRTRSSR